MPPTLARLENLLKGFRPKDRKLTEQFFEDHELVLTSKISYADSLVPFYKHVKKPLAKVAKGDIQRWLKSERARGISPGTISIHKRHIKAFYRWLAGGEKSPPSVSWIKWAGPKKDLPFEEILTEAEIRRMIEVATSPRDKALVAVIYESAMRVSEFLSLKVRNVDFDEYGAVILLPKDTPGLKTGSRRIRLIDAAPYLQAWINAHPRKNDPDAPLWPSQQGGGLKITQTRDIVVKYAAKAGIQKRVYPHLFRHSRLTHLAQIYNESELRELAGWSKSSNMPSIYLHVSGKSLDKKLLEHHNLLKPKEKEKPEEKPLEPLTCPRCSTINPADGKYCYKCSMVLTLKAAAELEGKRKRTDDLMGQLLEDPEVLALFKRKLKKMKARA